MTKVIKQNRKIIGFYYQDSKGQFWAAFGKPSQSNYISFAVDNEQAAINFIHKF